MTAAPDRLALRARHLRFLKFSLIGGIGVAVQLVVLAALTRAGVNYLWATALAVESAVLHNFLWHQRFTWADRPGSRQTLVRLLRFHLGNGAISVFGNLLVMRLLVGWLALPVIIANVLTIAICALANFAVGDGWVFAALTEVSPHAAAERSRISNSVRCAKGT